MISRTWQLPFWPRRGAFSALKSLRLGSCQNISHSYEEEDFVGPLCRELVPLLNRLRVLDAEKCGITWQGAAFLAEHYRGHLNRLSLRGSYLYRHSQDNEQLPFVEDFLGSNLFGSVASLDMGSSYIDDGILELLLRDSDTQHREIFLMNNSGLGRESGRLLGNASFPNLRILHIDSQSNPSWRSSAIGMNDLEISHLFCSEGYPNLANFSARRHQLTAGCFEHLLEAPFLKQLYYVDLSHNLIRDDGLQRLIDHGPWEQLAELNLRHNQISREYKTKLIATFGDRVLV